MMTSQSFDYWLPQGDFMPPPQTTVFDMPPNPHKVPSPSASPTSSTYDQFPAPTHQIYYPQTVDKPIHPGPYSLPMTPPDLESEEDGPFCSPRPLPHIEPRLAHTSYAIPVERTHTTSGRRRAQNCAAQRAFRERKEKHARALESQLSALTDKYSELEVSHLQLSTAYETLRRTIKLLTQDNDAQGRDEEGKGICRRTGGSDTLRKLLDVLDGEVKGVVPIESETS